MEVVLCYTNAFKRNAIKLDLNKLGIEPKARTLLEIEKNCLQNTRSGVLFLEYEPSKHNEIASLINNIRNECAVRGYYRYIVLDYSHVDYMCTTAVRRASSLHVDKFIKQQIGKGGLKDIVSEAGITADAIDQFRRDYPSFINSLNYDDFAMQKSQVQSYIMATLLHTNKALFTITSFSLIDNNEYRELSSYSLYLIFTETRCLAGGQIQPITLGVVEILESRQMYPFETSLFRARYLQKTGKHLEAIKSLLNAHCIVSDDGNVFVDLAVSCVETRNSNDLVAAFRRFHASQSSKSSYATLICYYKIVTVIGTKFTWARKQVLSEINNHKRKLPLLEKAHYESVVAVINAIGFMNCNKVVSAKVSFGSVDASLKISPRTRPLYDLLIVSSLIYCAKAGKWRQIIKLLKNNELPKDKPKMVAAVKKHVLSLQDDMALVSQVLDTKKAAIKALAVSKRHNHSVDVLEAVTNNLADQFLRTRQVLDVIKRYEKHEKVVSIFDRARERPRLDTAGVRQRIFSRPVSLSGNPRQEPLRKKA